MPGTTDADRLAAQMRLLATNANDLSALLAAGELSIRLDDLGAAASFFARADKVDPRNGRAKAGEGAILVHAERPGEALRYFTLAESYGLAPAMFAANRGLAYDLIGEQERAQRDYRLALRTAPDEETQRRYALSLAIAGKRELAEQQLQALLRQSDRGAWRVHAFVLAMGGNVAEASRIATTMMPPGTAAGLQPFLEKLPTLAPVDRAFAVHFGEVRSTPERIADARLVTALPALGPDPYAPRVAVASAVAPVDKGKRRAKDRGKRDAVQVAVAVPAPEPLPQAPGYNARPGVAIATRGAAPAAWPTATATVPANRPASSSPVTLAASRSLPAVTEARRAPAAWPTAITPPIATPPPATRPAAPVATVAMAVAPASSPPPPETNVVVAASVPVAQTASPSAVAPVVTRSVDTVVATAATGTAPAAWPTAVTPETPRPSLASAPRATGASESAVAEAVAVRRPRDDGALSRMIAGLPIPAAELGVAGPVRPTPAPPAEASADAAAAQQAADRAARAAAARALADKRAADRKAAADKKALAEKKAAAEEKAEAAREAAAQKKLERANPERIWVQVAGGAFAGDLPKAWAAAKAKGGEVFAGHASGWTTPLRATNRVLAGPFRTDAEARAFVNRLKAGGMSTFTFTSEAGQVVTKLPAK